MKRQPVTTGAQQRGVALLLAVMVVAVATIIGVEIWHANQLDVARVANQRQALQAEYYARGLALWAADILREDFERDGAFDSHGDAWNQPVAGIAVPEGQLAGRLTDLSGKFNLNNLVNADGSENPNQVAYFRRLLRRLQLSESLADKLLDWMDKDNQPRPQGAEDFTYQARNPGYFTASSPLFHVAELRLVDGVDKSTYETLRKHVTVLPTHRAKINLNTASVPVLLALDDRLTPQQAIILHQQGQAAYHSLPEFVQHPALANNPLALDHLGELAAVASQWFQAASVVQLGQSEYVFYALVQRKGAFAQALLWSPRPFVD